MRDAIKKITERWQGRLDEPSRVPRHCMLGILADLESAVADDEDRERSVRVTHLADVVKLVFRAVTEIELGMVQRPATHVLIRDVTERVMAMMQERTHKEEMNKRAGA